ncbi:MULTISPECIES: hypothetical protein [Actinosynnema]|uniref:hypothetical protein n=1 Tax=Actinosynnema TaxID=40566 RepID=UPI0020A4DFD6|nr:hypothetical protein [Actinosynnema pretiosum]
MEVDNLIPAYSRKVLLVVEYDGAYWHAGREKYDRWKVERSLDAAQWQESEVVRVREEPLLPLRLSDVWVPKRSSAVMCARLILLHLLQGFLVPLRAHDVCKRVEHFLAAAAKPLKKDEIHCEQCWKLASALREAGLK